MNWLQQWISNKENKKVANPIDATNVANKWRNAADSTGFPITEGPGTKLITKEDGTVMRVPEKDIVPKEGNILDYSGLPGNTGNKDADLVGGNLDPLGTGLGLPGNTDPLNLDPSVSEKVDIFLENGNNTTFTEGPDTKLIQTEDGTVMRVPVDQDIIGSTTIQVDDQAPVGEVDFESIPTEDNAEQNIEPVLGMEDAKSEWLYKTRNSPAAKAGHSDERRWELHLKNKAFQLAKKNKTLDQFVEDYPNSPYSKDVKRNKRMTNSTGKWYR